MARLPSNMTRAELSQAQSLVFRGKGWVTAPGSRLRKIVNYLAEKGFESAEQQVVTKLSQKFMAEAKAQDQPQIPRTQEQLARIKRTAEIAKRAGITLGKVEAGQLREGTKVVVTRGRLKGIKFIPTGTTQKEKEMLHQVRTQIRIIPSQQKPNKKLVILPTGKRFTIAKFGRTVVGKEFAGQRLEFFDGKLITDLGKNLPTEGFNLTSSEEAEIVKLLPSRIILVKDETGLIVGTKDKSTGRTESIAAIDKYIDEKSRADLKAKGRLIESSTELVQKWRKDLNQIKNRLDQADQAGDLDRLRELQRLGGNATAKQKEERKKLEKKTAKNYKLGGEFIMKTVGVTFINMGLGGRELLIALKNNPKATLIALPPAIYEGVKTDFNRVMSGDPLVIAQVGAEYWTYSFVMGTIGKGAKAALKVPVSIGRTLSPKYFSKIGTKLVIPPAALRGAIGKTLIGAKVRALVKVALKKAGAKAKLNSFLRNVKRTRGIVNKRLDIISKRALKPVRKIKGKIKVSKALREIEIKKFRSAVDYKKQLNRARRARKVARKKGRTINIGDRNFIEAVVFIEEVAAKLAKVRAKQFLKAFKKRGGKIGLGQEEQFIKAIQKYVNENLNSFEAFKKLKNTVRLKTPFQIKLLKAGKIASAKKLFNGLMLRLKKIPIVKQMNAIIKRISRKIKKFKKKVSPKRIKAKLKMRKLKRIGRREFRKTNRYRMLKTRKVRKVTIEKLNRSQSISQARKFIDDFFNEMGRRQKIDITTLQFRQLKNVLKKRISLAIRRGDKVEIAKFRNSIRELINNLNKKTSHPSVRVIEKTGKTRRTRTIKDFKPETPKGQYVEVKSGQQVLLQEVRQIQKARVVQKLVPPQQVFIIKSVAKQSISLKPLMKYVTFSLSAQAVRNIQRTKQVFTTTPTQSQLVKVLQDSAQDFRTAQAVAQSPTLKMNVAQAVAQAVRSRQRIRQKLKTKQIQKKKQVLKLRLPKKFKRRTLKKSIPVFFVKEKIRGKLRNLTPKPLTLQAAKDFLAYRLDNRLSRSGFFVPMGKSKVIVKLPPRIVGYYARNKRKLRPYKIKLGRRKQLLNGFIEKKKYIGDTRSEIKQLQASRRKAKKKKVIKRKTPVRKKKVVRKSPVKRRRTKKKK